MKSLLFTVLISLSCPGVQAQKTTSMKDSSHIPTFSTQLEEVYTVFISSDIKKCKEFYTHHFGFTIVFESSWFILLQSAGKKPFLLAFMSEEHPSSPPSPRPMKGDGSFLTLQVTDAKKVYDSMVRSGIKISYHLKDEEWGQRRFAVVDPNGMHVDIVEQTMPAAGYWDKYIQ